MKTRRHHNNKGTTKIKRGKTFYWLKRLAARMGVKFGEANTKEGNE